MNWSQLRTVLWLRWRLTCNQWARTGWLGAVLSGLALSAALMLALAAGVGGVFAGALELAEAKPMVLLLVWDGIIGGFLFLWLLGVVTEIQRSETIDLARLLHLPVSLKGVFVVNYLASHLSIGVLLFLPGSLGLCAGLIWGRGWLMVLLIPLALTTIFMTTAWTYCLRGWLVALMVNPRRRRNVIMAVTLAAVLLGQLPNLYFNVYLHHGQGRNRPAGGQVPVTPLAPGEIPPVFMSAHNYVPVLWLPRGAMALGQGRVLPALLGALGAFLLGLAGLARAYRSTMRFYTGEEKSWRVKAAPAPSKAGARAPDFLERRIPVVREDVAVLALATIRSMSRAPEVRMSLVMNLVMVLVLAVMGVSKVPAALPEATQPLLAAGAVGFTFFGLLQILFNQFGFDRDGFRALILLPARRRDVLLGKNLALAPLAHGFGITCLGLLAIFAHLSPFVILAGGLQLTAMFLLLCVLGNFLSVMVPYRISAGSLKPNKPPALTVLLIMVSHLLFPVAMLPVAATLALAYGVGLWTGWPALWLDLFFSLALLGVSAGVYAASLGGLGRLLEIREQKILLVVSQEPE